MDGGSSDETVSVLHKYDHWLAHWRSTPDAGQSHAINEGFRHATGELCAWIGCDDRLLPGALVRAGLYFAERPDCLWLAGSGKLLFPATGRVGVMASRVESLDALQSFWRFGSAECFVAQPSCFWRRRLWDAVGGLRADLHLTMDYDLWLRFAERAELHRCDDVFSIAVRAAGGKTFDQGRDQVQELMRCAYQFAARRGRAGRALTAAFLHWYALERLRWGRDHALRGEYRAAMLEFRRLVEAPFRVLAESGRVEMLQH
jgi:glycosyltransferase involved in cell wall biosynthesis